jgi:hypothetical protein
MHKVILGILLILTIGAFAANRTVTTKVAKADTTFKVDTARIIKYDTMLITKTFKDTSILLKTDTAKIIPAVKPKK